MRVPAAIFRQYDIRGTVGDQLTDELAHAIGQGVATLSRTRLGGDRVQLDHEAHAAGPRHVLRIPAQPVAQIDHRGRTAGGQRLAGSKPG